MHELGIAEALVRKAEEIGSAEGAIRVVRIDVALGAFSGVVRESLELAFPIAAAGTVAEGAALAVEEIPVAVECRGCGARTQPDYPYVACGACGGGDVAVVQGTDLRIVSMEVADV